jgi:hypothetical protein
LKLEKKSNIGGNCKKKLKIFPKSAFYPNRLALKAHLAAIEGVLTQVNAPPAASGRDGGGGRSNPLFAILLPVLPKFFQLNRFIFDCIFLILLIIIIIGSKIYM